MFVGLAGDTKRKQGNICDATAKGTVLDNYFS